MRRFAHDDPVRRHAVTVARDDHARNVDVGLCQFDRSRHRGRRFSSTDRDAATHRLIRQVPRQLPPRGRGSNCGVEHGPKHRFN
jgi:hypothetical protein